MKNDKGIMILGQLSPPITGELQMNKLVSRTLMREGFSITEINSSLISNVSEVGTFKFKKIILMFRIYLNFMLKIHNCKLIYVSPGQSFMGIVRYYPMLIVAKLFKLKIIAHWHGYGVLSLTKNNSLIMKIFSNVIDANILLTHDIQLRLGEIDSNLKSKVVIHNCVPEPIRLDEAKLNKVKQPLKVLFIGSLIEDKGFMNFIEAAKFLDTVNFTICGTGTPEALTIVKLAQLNTSNLTYKGEVTSTAKSKLLQNADIFVLQSNYSIEGAPISLLEAMQSGCAIITTKINGIPETVGNAGRFIEIKSTSALVEEICHFSENPSILKYYKHLSIKRAKNFSQHKFSSEVVSSIKRVLCREG